MRGYIDNNRDRILWITRTASFIALLIVSQAATAPLGNQFVTGSIVNFLLIVSVMTCGLTSGFTVSILSHIMAKFFGIGPLWSLVPFVAAGNIVLVVIWYFIGNRSAGGRYMNYAAALVLAALGKFLTLYAGIVKIAVPILLDLPERQASVISFMFSFPQIITASIGGVMACILLPVLEKTVFAAKE